LPKTLAIHRQIGNPKKNLKNPNENPGNPNKIFFLTKPNKTKLKSGKSNQKDKIMEIQTKNPGNLNTKSSKAK
jgi:hypothetical protein